MSPMMTFRWHLVSWMKKKYLIRRFSLSLNETKMPRKCHNQWHFMIPYSLSSYFSLLFRFQLSSLFCTWTILNVSQLTANLFTWKVDNLGTSTINKTIKMKALITVFLNLFYLTKIQNITCKKNQLKNFQNSIWYALSNALWLCTV